MLVQLVIKSFFFMFITKGEGRLIRQVMGVADDGGVVDAFPITSIVSCLLFLV